MVAGGSGCGEKAPHPPAHAQSKSVRECIAELDSSDPQVVTAAIRQLGQSGTDGKPAVEALVRIADGENGPLELRQAAGWALTRIGLSFEIEESRTNADAEVREYYVGQFGRSHAMRKWRDRAAYMEMVVPALLWSSRNHGSARLRNSAVLGLGCLCDEPKEEAVAESIVRVLIEAMRDSDREVRISAVVALGDYGRRAKVALPILKALVDDPDEEMRHQVRRGIWCIEEDMKGPQLP